MQCEAAASPAIDAAANLVTFQPHRAAVLAAAVAGIDHQAGGVIRLVEVNAAGWEALVAAHDGADLVARALHTLIGSILVARAENRPDALRWCARCTFPLEAGRFVLVAVIPDCPEPDSGVVVPVCTACGRNSFTLTAAADALRCIWPTLRLLPPAELQPSTPAGSLH